MSRVCGRKYSTWFIFVAIFSAFPILMNLLLDYLGTTSGIFKISGVRLMDFLVCGCCLIGGALCDRFNANLKPSALSIGIALLISFGAYGLYLFIKYSTALNNSLGIYPNDDKIVTLIIISYIAALLLSVFLLRKTLTTEEVSQKSNSIFKFFQTYFYF